LVDKTKISGKGFLFGNTVDLIFSVRGYLPRCQLFESLDYHGAPPCFVRIVELVETVKVVEIVLQKSEIDFNSFNGFNGLNDKLTSDLLGTPNLMRRQLTSFL